MGHRPYRLVIEGELSDRIGFEGMALAREAGKTVLTGNIRDQSELQGLLQRVSALGLTLLAVTALDTAGDPTGPAGAGTP